MKDKIIIVTGANSGIGKALAKKFLEDRYHVVMVCRSEVRAKEAVDELSAVYPEADISTFVCDLAKMTDVVKLSDDLKRHYPIIDVLVNNAGVILTKRSVTDEGFEQQLAVNFLAPVLLTHLLMPSLRKSDDPRVVTVSSGAHKAGKIYKDDFQLTQNYGAFRAYGQSKLAITMMTSMMGEGYHDLGVVVNCYHPGTVATNISVDRETGARAKLMKWVGLFFVTPEEGARTGYYLAHNKSARRIWGGYFYKEKLAKTAKAVMDEELRLWLKRETLKLLKPFGFDEVATVVVKER